MTGSSLLLLAPLLLPLQASPAPPALADDPAFNAGVAMFEDFEYEKAVFRFQEALRVEGRSPADRATILIRLGMTYAELRDDGRAMTSFEEALRTDPLAGLPPDASPKIVAMLDEARRKVRAARPADAPAEALPDSAPDEVAPAPPSEGAHAAAPAPSPETAEGDGGFPFILVSGGVVLGLGVLGAAAGGAVWAGGLFLREQGNAQTFQSDAAAYNTPAVVGQVAGQALLGAGLLALVVGGGVALVAVVVE